VTDPTPGGQPSPQAGGTQPAPPIGLLASASAPPTAVASLAPPEYEPTEPTKFYQRWPFWLLVIAALSLVAVFAGMVSGNSGIQHPTVVYTVTSDSDHADITYMGINRDGSGGREQVTNAALPWTLTIRGKNDLSAYSITAQANEWGRYITCQIAVNGQVQVSRITTGPNFPYVICSTEP